jgi:hypothetical protein
MVPGQQPSLHSRRGLHGGTGGPRAGDQDRAGSAEAAELLDRLAHDALVVRGVTEPDAEESPEPDADESSELEVEDELDGGEPDVALALEVDA